jgi:hypothetical protein
MGFGAAVEALVLAFLDRTTFAYADMVRAGHGQCMLHPQLARAAVATCRLKQDRITEGATELRTLRMEGEHLSR